MSHVVEPLDRPSTYKDRSIRDTDAAKAAREALKNSTTLYVGNLSFYTTEAQIYELFSQCAMPEEGGGIKRIIMGLHRETSAPCGFAFVEYHLHNEALASMRYISGTKLDERVIRCDLDPGYQEGRQFGRGKSGGQVRDEYREEYDGGRGGWGVQAQIQERRRREEQDRIRGAALHTTYATKYGNIARDGEDVPTGEPPDDEFGRKRRRGSGSSDSHSDGEGRARGAPQRRGEQEDD